MAQRVKDTKAVIEKMAYRQTKAYMKEVISMCYKSGLTPQETSDVIIAAKAGIASTQKGGSK